MPRTTSNQRHGMGIMGTPLKLLYSPDLYSCFILTRYYKYIRYIRSKYLIPSLDFNVFKNHCLMGGGVRFWISQRTSPGQKLNCNCLNSRHVPVGEIKEYLHPWVNPGSTPRMGLPRTGGTSSSFFKFAVNTDTEAFSAFLFISFLKINRYCWHIL